jgi:TRAP-type mannitol/chloroaromatic compound transport system substrate-binding protein
MVAHCQMRHAQPALDQALFAAGAQLRPFSLEILHTIYKAKLFVEASAKTANFKRHYRSMMAFRNDQYAWHQVCENTYDTDMIRQRSRTSAAARRRQQEGAD